MLRRHSRPSTGPKTPVPTDDDAAQAFADIADRLARFHTEASDSVERKAVAILGFAGVALTLVPILATAPTPPFSCWDRIGLALTALGAVLLVATAVASALVIQTQDFNYPSIVSFSDYLTEHMTTTRWKASKVYGTWARALFRTESADHAGTPLVDIQKHAKTRANRFKATYWLLVASIVSLGLSVLILTLDAAF